MKCAVCKQQSSVIDSRIVRGVRWRRRTCQCDTSWFTKEIRSSKEWPYVDPRIKAKPKPKKRKKPIAKTEKPSFTPAQEKWGIKITKESPAWLKKIALALT